jgi:serine/threonine protein kinase
MNEISIMKGLNHPNVMRLEEIHETVNSIYLITEVLEGGMFNSRFVTKSITTEQIKKYMADVLGGLAYLDSKNIMHRDIKPDNILFRKKDQEELVLVDFGLASDVEQPEYLFKRCGTPGYVAPEIINASSKKHTKFSTKCDVFSVGVMLYML